MSQYKTLSSFAAAFAFVTLAGSALPSCADDFSTDRPKTATGITLGEDIFSGLCDRVGATSLAEDLTGASYHALCHQEAGAWGDKVETARLPSLLETDERGQRARRLSVAKLETMARRRGELIAAFDALFPDVEIADPFEAGKKVRLHDALDLLTKRMTPLYDSDPYAAGQLFTGLLDILFKHWPSDGSGLWRDEELADWVMNQSDLFETLKVLVPELRDQPYVSPRVRPGQTRPGLEITAAMLPVIFDPAEAKKLGAKTRAGENRVKANDGTEKDLALFDLFAGALRRSDARFAALGPEGESRKAAWREARSELSDQFLLASGGAWQNVAVEQAFGPLGRLMREQLNARCPDRETQGSCAWARDELSADVADMLGGPLFAALADLGDALAADPAAREALEVLVGDLLEQAQDPDVLADMMVSAADFLQLLQDEPNLVPLLNTMSVAVAPSGGRETPGMADSSLKLLRALLDDRDDLPADEARAKVVGRYHVVDAVLKNAVSPMGPGGRSPFEVLADVVSDVHRVDSAAPSPLDADDYRAMGDSLRSFLTDPYRGLEQFYTIIRDRNGN